MTAALIISVTVGLALILWLRWITRRRKFWFTELTNRIPVNATWWREQRAREGDLLYVAIGDSTAQGIGASRPGRSYVGTVAKHIRAQTDSPLRVVNLGMSGATVAIAVEKQLPALAKLHPDIVTVSIGANDIPTFDPARFRRDLDQLFGALPESAVVADLPTFYFLPAERKVRQANVILRAVAKRYRLKVVPLHATMKQQGMWGVTTQFAGDLFHPNDRGYEVWGSAFLDAVDARLADLGRAPG